MKKHLLMTMLCMLSVLVTFGQRTTYTAQSVVANSSFTSNFGSNNWVSKTNNTWTRNNSSRANRSGQANGDSLYQNITGAAVNDGYLILRFDVKLYKNNSNVQDTMSLVVGWNGVRYLDIRRSRTVGPEVHFTTYNNATYSYITTAFLNNTGYSNGYGTIELRIPVAGSGSTANGRLAFVARTIKNSSQDVTSSFYTIDNVQFYTRATTNPYSPTCNNCIPLSVSNGTIDYNDVPPTPECGQAEGNRQYVYYLPAVADLPATLKSTDPNPPAQIIILSEMATANVVIRRPSSNTPIVSRAVPKDSVYRYTTNMNDMFTSSYSTKYSNRGFVIESDQPILVRWSLNHQHNWESVVLRGENAKGKAFRAASVLYATRGNGGASGNTSEGVHFITVMATENNTKVQIGKTANAVSGSDFDSIRLNKGEQYTVTSYTEPVSGRLILADKHVVVSSGQQHKRIMGGGNGFETSTSLEGTVIQLQPTYTLGKVYLITTTQGYDGFQVVAVQNNTIVRKNGAVVATLQAGESYQQYNKTDSATGWYGKGSYYITTSEPSYVYNLGANSIGEFEMFPAPAADLPVGKSGKVVYDSTQGKSGWVVVNSSDTSKLKRNNSSSLGYSVKTNFASPATGVPSKTVYYWNTTFAPNISNDITCTGCDGMYVGQLADGGSGGAQVGYISSFDGKPLQFYNTKFLPTELLTSGYVFDSINYGLGNPGTVTHMLTIASSAGGETIDSVVITRSGNNPDKGSVLQIHNTSNNLGFTLATPSTPSVSAGMADTIYTTVYVRDQANNVAALCLSYLVSNIEVLPVKLTEFNAHKVQQTALLKWTTASEYNNLGFEVQRSVNGQDWENIGWVASMSEDGNSERVFKYEFVDEQPYEGLNYYRLKQLDIVGKFEYTNVKTLEFKGQTQVVRVYPNPAQNVVNMEGLKGQERIRVYNFAGQLVIDTKATTQKMELGINHLPAGMYQVQILNDQEMVTSIKLVKE